MNKDINFHLEELASGVFAAIATSRGAAFSNMGIIDLGEQTLIFDTSETPTAAAELRQAAISQTGHRISVVINSHAHDDHWQGNQVFADDALIVSTHRTRQEIERETADLDITEDIQELTRYLEELRGNLASTSDPDQKDILEKTIIRVGHTIEMLPSLRVCLPNQTFEGKLVFHGSDRSGLLIESGPAHTFGDCYLLLPEEKLAFIGDIGFFQSQPFMLSCDPFGWLEALKVLNDLDVEKFVPGHGPVGTKNDLILLKEYIEYLLEKVGVAIKAGKSQQEFLTEPLPAPFDAWTKRSQRLQANVNFLYEYLCNEQDDR